MKYYAIMELPQGDHAAVGPFDDRDDAASWGDNNEDGLSVTMRGTVLQMSRTTFARKVASSRTE